MATAVILICLQSKSVSDLSSEVCLLTKSLRLTRSVRFIYVYNGRHDQISEVHLCLQWETRPDQWGSPMSTMGDTTRSVRFTYVYNGRHDQFSEVHLCLQWETRPDQWGSPMSTMGDTTRSMRFTCVYNGKHIFTEAVRLTSPQRESKYAQMSEVHLSTETDWPKREVHLSRERDRLTQAERFTCLEKETDWPKWWGSPVHTESQRLTQQTKYMVKLTSTDLFSTALMKSLNSLKGVPGPHRPNRVM